MINIDKNRLYLAVFILLVLNLWLWQAVLAVNLPQESTAYFLDVGQGDSQLLILDGIKILIDGGRDKKVLEELEKLENQNKYIDLVVMTHPDIDHYGGLIDIARRYRIGAFISNGKESSYASFNELKEAINKENILKIILAAGDKIKYKSNVINIIAPDKNLIAGLNDNESSLVMLAGISGKKILFTGDVGFETEQWLLHKGINLKSDILKVGHHGSKNSSSADFINATGPKISVVSVGRNSYGHPSGQALKLLAAANSIIYRTDMDGTIKITLGNDFNLPNPKYSFEIIDYPVDIAYVQPHSSLSATDEFVKLHNSGNKEIDLTGWTLKKQTKSGKEYLLVSAKKFTGHLSPNGYFTIAHYDYNGEPDLFYSNKTHSLAKTNNSVLLFDGQGNLVDKYSY